jgi:L-2-hydroxyglutarate oxidase LhgO
MTLEVDCIVIGAGVVGLAVARALQLNGREVVLLEKERTFGTETSSRNSEVIHAGIYYQPGTLKAKLCVRGKELLYEYCQTKGVPHKPIGKIIVATQETETATLEKYLSTAQANGVDDLEWLNAAQLQEREPMVKAIRGLWSPSTGIIDSHVYMQALLNDFEISGGQFVRTSPVVGGSIVRGEIKLNLSDIENSVVMARTVVNCAGLHAPSLAASIDGLPVEMMSRSYYAIGHYYTFAGKPPFRHLIYPVASKGGLGVHVTLDMSGAVRFGPDVRWRDSIDYSFDDSCRGEFVKAIRTYYPEIKDSDLIPSYTGMRPKISGPENPNHDFLIQNGSDYGVPGLINLFGIESPGLTASLAIGELVSDMLELSSRS